MHYYDCPCDECRQASDGALYERLITLIERLEAELDRPRIAEYDRALAWLASACGGHDAVLALTGAPLGGDVPLPLDARVAEVAQLLRGLAAEHFDAETEVAFLRCLARVWEIDPGLVTAPVLASYAATGVAWAVGEANGTVGSGRPMTAARLKQVLGVPSAPRVYARPIRRALTGPWEWRVETSDWSSTAPDLETLGDSGLLTARTRQALIRVRDRALAARALDREAA